MLMRLVLSNWTLARPIKIDCANFGEQRLFGLVKNLLVAGNISLCVSDYSMGQVGLASLG